MVSKSRTFNACCARVQVYRSRVFLGLPCPMYSIRSGKSGNMDLSPRRSKLQLVTQWRESVGLTPFSHLASSTPTSSLTWITWFCSLPGHEYFSEVSEDFIEDDFNLTGLNSMVPFWKEAMEMVLDVEPGESSCSVTHDEYCKLTAPLSRFACRRGFSQDSRRLYRGGFRRTAIRTCAPTLHFDARGTRGNGVF